jgi:hypothetical protein
MTTTNTARAAYIPTTRSTRTRVGNAMSPARRNAFLDSFVARVNASVITAAQYLTDVLGADAEFVRRFSGTFGKAVAKAWREQFGTEPTKSGLARVRRMLLPVFAYTADAATLTVLDKAARSYTRTAQLLAA